MLPQWESKSSPNRVDQKVNEFYEKGSQEKTSASTGGREDLRLDLQPAVWRSTRMSGACSGRLHRSVVLSAGDDKHDQV